jgi:hypothetical protein
MHRYRNFYTNKKRKIMGRRRGKGDSNQDQINY